ncbi:hypothetical protein FOZ62_007871 [Perkinsus olseni]|uniref:CHK kinase-like domain-containing protein n=2 Tax=Perkinsus olseni TaxID=32597 RepID=A0A7J6PZB2_PEROL|nr:hypothetical protein FOZ62_007871 [Perkinsus olseni]
MTDTENTEFDSTAAADQLQRKLEIASALKVPFDTVHPAKGADGMLSDQYEAKTKDGEPLFVKYLPAKGFAHDFCLELDVYGREQSCLAFFNEAGIHEKLRDIPDCRLYLPGLYYSDDRIIAMDNLVKSRNFEPYHMENPMSYSLAADCIKALAYFHAVVPIEAARSRYLKPREATHHVMGKILDEGIACLEKAGDSLIDSEARDIIVKNRDFIQDVMVGNPNKLTIGDAILVVAHEDMWSNNIMTHQREDGTMEIAIVDHQFPEVDTPTVDIVFFIFCSMAVDERRAHLKDLVHLYAETFAAASKEYPSSSQIPASPLCSSSTGTFNATVKLSALSEEGPDVFLLQLRFYEDGTVRFTMDENHDIVGDIRTRYVIPSGDIIQDENMPLAKDLEYTYSQEEKSSTFRVGKSIVVKLMHAGVVLTVAVDGQVVQTINSKKHLVIEGTRYEYNDKCPFNLPSCYDAKYIDPACSPGTHDGSWAEEYEGKTDFKADGPSLVGIDITFSETEAAYGLQERGTTSSKLKIGGTSDLCLYRFFNLDYAAYPVDGDRAQGAIYGAIPTLTAVQKGTGPTPTTSSLLWVNPSDTLVALTGGCGGDLTSTFVSESGVIDMLLYPGMKPQEFSTAYHRTTGLPALPPLFGLGFHRSRYAVESQQDIYNLAYKYTDKGFPVDVFWLDIEHTNGKEYFTWNETLFPDPKKMSDDIRDQGKEMVTIVDPHIKVSESYFVYTSGVKKDVFVKQVNYRRHPPTTKIFEADCWPGLSAWPDFISPRVRDWWGSFFKPDNLNDNFYTWNDMNEPSVFDVPEKTMYRNLVHIGAADSAALSTEMSITCTATISDGHPSKANVYTASQENVRSCSHAASSSEATGVRSDVDRGFGV